MMIKCEEKREPFPWKYGILYVNRERTGPNIKVYQTEKDRDEAFNKALVTLKIKRSLDPEPTEIKSMVKVLIQGDTYKAVE